MKTMLIVTISIVIWCPREQIPPLGSRWGPPTPLTMVKCVELAIDTESGSLVFADRWNDGSEWRCACFCSSDADCWGESESISSMEMMAAAAEAAAAAAEVASSARAPYFIVILLLYLLPTASMMAAAGTMPTVDDRYSSMALLVP